MQSLKYLHLNFKRYLCTCDYASCYSRSFDVHLKFYDELITGDNLISNIETLIIGSKLLLLLFRSFSYFYRYSLFLCQSDKNKIMV